MANIQYIGARYVPKFFDNPDDHSNNWKSDIGYEALIIVLYNDDSYTSKMPVPSNVGNPADNPAYWAKTGNFNAALTALQTNVAEILTITDNILVPDQLSDVSDTAALQAAFDLLKDVGGTIVLNREYKLTGDIYIRHDSDADDNTINIVGLSKECGIDFDDYSINGYDQIQRIWGGLRFINCLLHGNEKGFITDNLIRLFFTSCTIKDFKYFLYGTANSSSQSIFISDCYIRKISESVMYSSNKAWDTHITGSLIERCTNLVDIDGARVLVITNNLIENMYDADRLDNCKIRLSGDYRDVLIQGNYFEENGCDIDMSACGNNETCNATIADNSVWMNLHNVTSIILPKSVTVSRIKLLSNTISSPYNDGYAIAISETGHSLYGVYLSGNIGTNFALYDPDKQLYDVMRDTPVLTFTKTANYTDETAPRVYCDGKTVHVSVLGTLNASLSSNDVIIKIDDDYLYPGRNMTTTINIVDASNNVTSVLGVVNESGEIKTLASIASGTKIQLDITWIAK